MCKISCAKFYLCHTHEAENKESFKNFNHYSSSNSMSSINRAKETYKLTSLQNTCVPVQAKECKKRTLESKNCEWSVTVVIIVAVSYSETEFLPTY